MRKRRNSTPSGYEPESMNTERRLPQSDRKATFG